MHVVHGMGTLERLNNLVLPSKVHPVVFSWIFLLPKTTFLIKTQKHKNNKIRKFRIPNEIKFWYPLQEGNLLTKNDKQNMIIKLVCKLVLLHFYKVIEVKMYG